MRKLLLLTALSASFAGSSFGALVFGLNLNGSATSSPGIGSGLVTFDETTNTMRVQVVFSGLLGSTTVAHIHCCTAIPFTTPVGVATEVPTFPGFPAGVQSGSYDQTFDTTDPGSFNPGFVASNGGTAAGATAALIQGALDGKAYLNIHTSRNQGGEINGFLVLTPEPGTFGLAGGALAAAFFALRKRIRS
jgi:hypothetical protein